ncbi:5,10-methylenetetrahydrofolate reductase [Candidatus Aerophobetes bacterium]|uniref:5,10-methylenetetrahydrofolate reductase n=1 Tax=Aerophobetes bacterium TaxID=2030807 RepID=A0A662DDY8_UNCAE|nr:MAG: 5,10-methylenetetrahydrofolate reductase [Candidatus Aerophobetes bacterium]
MIGQVQKPLEEILEYLEGKERIVIIGCGGCATVFHTGGEEEVKKMADILSGKGKEILAAIAPPFGEFTCYAPWSKKRLNGYKKEIKECDAILMLTCGDGLQVVREFILEEEYGIVKPIYPGTNPMGHMGGGPTLFKEKCQQCGECELGKLAGICPLTQCAKGLLNGPCGGSQNGKCETDPEKDCAWILIYERLKKLGELDKLKKARAPHDWSKMKRPRMLEVKPLSLE